MCMSLLAGPQLGCELPFQSPGLPYALSMQHACQSQRCMILPGLAWPEFVLTFFFAKHMFLACFSLNMCMSLLAGLLGRTSIGL